jgi:cell fate regulator YaaT (PSP1 superfamily)
LRMPSIVSIMVSHPTFNMQQIIHIQMPEGGVVQCQLPETTELPQAGESWVCTLDYGKDVGCVVKITELPERNELPSFRLLRKQTDEDALRLKENETVATKAQHAFQLSVMHEKAHVKVLHVRFSFMRERLFVRYGASAVVDLRRFINQLQRDYKTVVDLWQVGVRDECAFMGCLGHCGRTACCCSWQRRFQELSTRMAKAQDIPLNPATAYGHCGCLKCCLAFEVEQYQEAGLGLPELGSVVQCAHEEQDVEGLVVGRDILRKKLTVRTREGRFLSVSSADLRLLRPARSTIPSKGEETHESAVSEWSEPEVAGNP